MATIADVVRVIESFAPVEIQENWDNCGLCAGSSLVDRARAAGAQLYLCGDVSYHHFFTPEGFMVMDIGHYESEIDIVSILFSLIQKNFPTFAVRIAQKSNNNPVFYL